MIWQRLKRLWEISGINVDGYEYETNRKQIINKVTDILRPNDEERDKNLEIYNNKQNKKLKAHFIPRIKEDPIKKITEKEI